MPSLELVLGLLIVLIISLLCYGTYVGMRQMKKDRNNLVFHQNMFLKSFLAQLIFDAALILILYPFLLFPSILGALALTIAVIVLYKKTKYLSERLYTIHIDQATFSVRWSNFRLVRGPLFAENTHRFTLAEISDASIIPATSLFSPAKLGFNYHGKPYAYQLFFYEREKTAALLSCLNAKTNQ